MATNLKFNLYPLISEAENNETARPNGLMLEYFQASVTLSSGEGTVEVPTSFGEILGVVPINQLASISDTTDQLEITTDCVVSSGAVTVVGKGADLADATYTIRGFLLGRKSETVLSF